MRITKEWAKQLAYEVWGELDFAGMTVEYTSTNNPSTYVIPVFVHNISFYKDIRIPVAHFERDEIRMLKVSDPINKEITNLGYSWIANHLVIGETIPYPER